MPACSTRHHHTANHTKWTNSMRAAGCYSVSAPVVNGMLDGRCRVHSPKRTKGKRSKCFGHVSWEQHAPARTGCTHRNVQSQMNPAGLHPMEQWHSDPGSCICGHSRWGTCKTPRTRAHHSSQFKIFASVYRTCMGLFVEQSLDLCPNLLATPKSSWWDNRIGAYIVSDTLLLQNLTASFMSV
jgi:hypothetical protein